MNQLRTELKAKLPELKNKQQVRQLLASDALDAKLVKFVVMQEGTPQGLAAFAQQGKEQEQLLVQSHDGRLALLPVQRT